MLSVLFFAASIHDNSKRPLRLLRFVPSEAWFLDVSGSKSSFVWFSFQTKHFNVVFQTQRLSDLVVAEVNALSGKQFFFLTRKLILAVSEEKKGKKKA
jgi:Trehalose receptor